MSLVLRIPGAFKIDFAPKHRQPKWGSWLIATVVSLVGALALDAVIVKIGVSLFPATRGYVHFEFSDYAKLTVIGVLGACIGWPIVTRISSAPRWLYLRLAILVTIVLLIPDVYIWHLGQSAKAVGVLMAMHLAIALVTYNAMVRIAPTPSSRMPQHVRRREPSNR